MTASADLALGVGRVTIELCLQDRALGERVVDLLLDSGFVRRSQVADAAGRLSIRAFDGPGRPPADSLGEIARHRSIRVLEDPDRLLRVVDGTSEMLLDPASGRLEANLDPDLRVRSVRDERFLLVLYGVLTFLRHRGLFPLHAGAVECDGTGCLLIGTSGSGKSSMALQLVRSGWGYVADDSVALQRMSDGAVEAVAMRRDAYLREADEERMELERWRECTEFEPVKYRVPIRETYPELCRAATVPRAIVFPSLTGREGSRWIRCEPHDALFSLLEHSSVSELEPSRTPEQVQVLRDLVLQTRSYRLLAGVELRNNPAAVSALLGSVLRDATGGERRGE